MSRTKKNNKDEIKQKEVIVAVSGGFDPVHKGHVRMFNAAKKLGDKLIVILNNDNWLKAKKGFYFMDELERKEIIESFASVDEVVITEHKANCSDMSVCQTLKKIKPHIFANGGDRQAKNIPEYTLCKKLGIKMVFNVGEGGKVNASSKLIERAYENLKNKILKSQNLQQKKKSS
jgi:D-beta-D-heptose 7-phosphate kinase/D-beta-D-heptose 1-phosphate adenosyltransferase